nr:uncharacterized protein LOC113393684 [Vanessa tameamea]
MEDLTPTKKVKRERNVGHLAVLKSPGLHGVDAEQAAARISKFMLVVSWRRRREEIRCVRKTLEFQVSCSERLRIQVIALKSLLDSDNAKVRLAIKELERLKQLLKEKDLEKAILEKAGGVAAASWSTCAPRPRARSARWRSSATRSRTRAPAATAPAAGAHAHCSRERSALSTRVALSALQTSTMSTEIEQMRTELTRLERELKTTREQLDWWPRPLTSYVNKKNTTPMIRQIRNLKSNSSNPVRMLGVARTWIRRPMSISDAVLWILIPARHGF